MINLGFTIPFLAPEEENMPQIFYTKFTSINIYIFFLIGEGMTGGGGGGGGDLLF